MKFRNMVPTEVSDDAGSLMSSGLSFCCPHMMEKKKKQVLLSLLARPPFPT
jgi:hypothetical protein